MTSVQREALVRWHGGDLFDDDFSVFAAAYAAEHPADDAEPITEEWFVATYGNMWVGIEPVGGGPIATLHYDPLGGCDGWSIGNEIIPPMETRGQLRRLIAALKGE